MSSVKSWSYFLVLLGTSQSTIPTRLFSCLQLLKNLSDVATLSAILKQIHSLSQFYVLYPKTLQVLMKQLVVCWSEGEEQVRILAFLNIRKYTILQTHPALSKVMKVNTDACGHAYYNSPLGSYCEQLILLSLFLFHLPHF